MPPSTCWLASRMSCWSRLHTTFITTPNSLLPLSSMLYSCRRSASLFRRRPLTIYIQHSNCLSLSLSLSLSPHSVAKLVAESMVMDSQKAITKCFESPPDDLLSLMASSPLFSPSLQCASMLFNVSLRRLVLVLEDEKRKGEESATPTPSKTSTGGDESEESPDIKVQVFNTCL